MIETASNLPMHADQRLDVAIASNPMVGIQRDLEDESAACHNKYA